MDFCCWLSISLLTWKCFAAFLIPSSLSKFWDLAICDCSEPVLNRTQQRSYVDDTWPEKDQEILNMPHLLYTRTIVKSVLIHGTSYDGLHQMSTHNFPSCRQYTMTEDIRQKMRFSCICCISAIRFRLTCTLASSSKEATFPKRLLPCELDPNLQIWGGGTIISISCHMIETRWQVGSNRWAMW